MAPRPTWHPRWPTGRNPAASDVFSLGATLFAEEEPIPLADGYTPLFVQGSRGREHLVVAACTRLSRGGAPGLTREEVGEPVGNALNHNLLGELLLSTTLVPPDLARIDPDEPGSSVGREGSRAEGTRTWP